MLTVDYDRLDLRAGHRLLDLGCGGGRHAFEALRRGASVVAADMDHEELRAVTTMYEAMTAEGEVRPDVAATATRGDATDLPFPDASFDRIIAAEVLEHIPDDTTALAELTRVLRPGGTLAVTVPAWLPERVCWALSEEYHAPFVEGGHLRIYRHRELRDKLGRAGLEHCDSHRAHSLHTPYWWLRCAVGPHDDGHRLVRSYHRFLTWDLMKRPRVTRLADRVLNPVLGKSIVVYARRPVASTPADADREERRAAA